MHMIQLITQGAQAPDAALTLNRMALGLFFAISGFAVGRLAGGAATPRYYSYAALHRAI